MEIISSVFFFFFLNTSYSTYKLLFSSLPRNRLHFAKFKAKGLLVVQES